jgi:hypothetical protein
MRTREHLQGLSKRAVGCHHAVLTTIRTHQIGQHACVAGIALGAPDCVSVAVTTGRQRVDRVDRVAGLQQSRDPQAAIGLDLDHDLARLSRVLSQQRMQLRDATSPSGSRCFASRAPCSSSTQTSWWASAQSSPTKITAPLPPPVDHPSESEKNLSDLMDQCSRHDIPPAIRSSRPPAGARSRTDMDA